MSVEKSQTFSFRIWFINTECRTGGHQWSSDFDIYNDSNVELAENSVATEIGVVWYN